MQNITSIIGILIIFSITVSIRLLQKKTRFDFKKILQPDRVSKSAFNQTQTLLNPHFIFNSLNNIYALTLEKSEHAPFAVEKFSNVLRHLLTNNVSKEVSLCKELEFIRDYIELQKLRLSDKANVILNVSGNSDNLLIEPFLFMPLLENAFKYGVDNRNRSVILIDMKIKKPDIYLSIKNSLQVIPSKIENSKTGQDNFEEKLHQNYKGRYQFDTIKGQNMYSTSLKLNLQNEVYSN